MKKRHEQKLVVLSFTLMFAFSLPFVLVFNKAEAIFGVPVFYFSVFLIWLLSVILSYVILKKYYE